MRRTLRFLVRTSLLAALLALASYNGQLRARILAVESKFEDYLTGDEVREIVLYDLDQMSGFWDMSCCEVITALNARRNERGTWAYAISRLI